MLDLLDAPHHNTRNISLLEFSTMLQVRSEQRWSRLASRCDMRMRCLAWRSVRIDHGDRTVARILRCGLWLGIAEQCKPLTGILRLRPRLTTHGILRSQWHRSIRLAFGVVALAELGLAMQFARISGCERLQSFRDTLGHILATLFPIEFIHLALANVHHLRRRQIRRLVTIQLMRHRRTGHGTLGDGRRQFSTVDGPVRRLVR